MASCRPIRLLPVLSATAAALWLVGTAAAQTLDTVPDFEGKDDFKAIARSSDEVWGASWGYCSVTAAIQSALAWCNDLLRKQGGPGTCRITRLGDANVAGSVGQTWTESVERYRQQVESDWLARSRASGYAIKVMIYGGEAEGWDEFVAGMARFDPKGTCMTDIDGGGPSVRCTGYDRFVGNLHANGTYPVYGETVLTCSNSQKVKGESVSLEPGVGFTCLITPGGGRVMVVFGPDSHAIGTTREAFLQAYNSLVAAAGLDRELCGWGLIS
jgi:hypothetical protein